MEQKKALHKMHPFCILPPRNTAEAQRQIKAFGGRNIIITTSNLEVLTYLPKTALYHSISGLTLFMQNAVNEAMQCRKNAATCCCTLWISKRAYWWMRAFENIHIARDYKEAITILQSYQQ